MLSLLRAFLFICLVLTVSTSTVVAFVPAPSQATSRRASRLLASSGGKGFGSTPPPPPKKKQSYNEESNRTVERQDTAEINMGQKALQELRRERAEQRDAELRKVRELKQMESYVKQQPDAAVIPEKVAMRMGKRMLPFVGLPLIGGMGAFVTFWYLATYKDMEFQPSLVAFTTIGILAVGLLVSNRCRLIVNVAEAFKEIVSLRSCHSLASLKHFETIKGITYSVMSASWDEDKEGSFLGVEEFTNNLDSLKGGLSRSKENLVLRERMAGMSEAEIQAALKDLEKRETPTTTIQSEIQDLQSKDE